MKGLSYSIPIYLTVVFVSYAQAQVGNSTGSTEEILRALNASNMTLGEFTRILTKGETLFDRLLSLVSNNNDSSRPKPSKSSNITLIKSPARTPDDERDPNRDQDDPQPDLPSVRGRVPSINGTTANSTNSTSTPGKVTITITLDKNKPLPFELIKAIIDSGATVSIPPAT